jgi:plastocyanin
VESHAAGIIRDNAWGMTSPLLRRGLTVAAAGVPLALTACAGPATIRVTSHHLYLHLTEYSMSPGAVSVPYGPLTVTATNVGVLTHNVQIDRDHRHSGGNLSTIENESITYVFPGQTLTRVLPALKPGTYVIVSTLANQTDLGMQTTLVVRRP